jgi:hypothetical protein
MGRRTGITVWLLVAICSAAIAAKGCLDAWRLSPPAEGQAALSAVVFAAFALLAVYVSYRNWRPRRKPFTPPTLHVRRAR